MPTCIKSAKKDIEMNKEKLWNDDLKCKRCVRHICLGIIQYQKSQCQDKIFECVEIDQDWSIIHIKWLKGKLQQQTGYYDKWPLDILFKVIFKFDLKQ